MENTWQNLPWQHIKQRYIQATDDITGFNCFCETIFYVFKNKDASKL